MATPYPTPSAPERHAGCSRGGRRPTRRQAIVQVGAGAFGLALPFLLARSAAAAGPGRARNCILLFLNGGASQYETFDPKPEGPSEVRGTYGALATRVPGLTLCELMPELARHPERYALVRSVTHTQPDHPAGVYWMITGRPYPRAGNLAVAMSRQDHPHLGSTLALLRPTATRALPSFVTLPEQMNPNGPIRAGQHAGFLGAALDPMVINGDPNAPGFTPGELRVTEGLTEGRLLRRRALLAQANLRARLEAETAAGTALPPHLAQAFDLVSGGEAARAFDLERESPATRDRYGRHVFGQSTLLARRLVEAGVRLVAVNWVRHDDGPGGQGWDSHANHLPWCRDELVPPTDRAVAALLGDLDERGLLAETLVLVLTEFGRTPHFNRDAGRDHWPHVFSVLLAGGGIRGGQVLGASTPDGAYPAADPVGPGDLAATLFHCLGIDPATEIRDPQDRPHPVAEGAVLHTLL